MLLQGGPTLPPWRRGPTLYLDNWLITGPNFACTINSWEAQRCFLTIKHMRDPKLLPEKITYERPNIASPQLTYQKANFDKYLLRGPTLLPWQLTYERPNVASGRPNVASLTINFTRGPTLLRDNWLIRDLTLLEQLTYEKPNVASWQLNLWAAQHCLQQITYERPNVAPWQLSMRGPLLVPNK